MQTSPSPPTPTEQVANPAAWVALGIVVAAAFPFDRVLAGMVRAGQGIEAICLYLGLTRTSLDDSLARLGLRTPHDRRMRKPGSHGWSLFDTTRLIAWRLAGIHPQTISTKLNRSVGAVRSKCRRLGIPTPERKSLRKVDPETLQDPGPDYFTAAARFAFGAASSGSASARCGTAAGPIVVRPPAPPSAPAQTPVSTAHLVEQSGAAPALQPAPARSPRQGKTPDQRALQLFRIIPGQPPVVPTSATTPSVADPSVEPVPMPAFAVPSSEAAVRLDGDLTWIGSVKHPLSHRAIVWAVSMLYFGGLHWRKIAARIGKTEAATRTILSRTWTPRDHDRSKFGEAFDEEAARATLESSGYELAYDDVAKQHYWRHRRFRSSIKQCRARRSKGGFDDYGRSEPITLVTRRDLDAQDRAGALPFAQGRISVGA